VTLYDAVGQVLRRSVEHFEPRQIPRRLRLAGSATYRVPLDPLPANTARVEVRAHEGTH
jgi:ribosomal protein S7